MAISERGKGQSPREQPPESPFSRPRKPTYGDLVSNPQVRKWATRGIVAFIVGVLLAIFIDLRVGVTVAIILVIVDTVRTARLGSSVEAWQKSSAVERRTERQLRGLEKKHGWRVLHARAVPQDEEGMSDGKIDHFVIGPTGIYAIDSVSWDRRLPVRALSHKKLYHGPKDMNDQLDEARWESDQASRLISAQLGYKVPVQASVAIYGPAISWKVLRVRDVDVYSGGRARTYLRRRPKILNATDVDRITEVAEQMLPPIYGKRADRRGSIEGADQRGSR
ncbi:MAG TPA: nuclease-related domain-containing protein [Streptosporangiaceae bacterium]|nr:nuclease-related domain-containing protein [Streptosporangiaceae bacterium]